MTWLNVIPALITGGTAYFVFISGFLYRQVFYGRTTYGEFMRKKALYVGLPYFVLATPLAFAEIWLGPFSVTAVKDGVAYPHSTFVDFIVLFSTGRMVTAYWYIPFIFLVFLASPLFDRFIELSKGWRAAALAASVAVALWIVRPRRKPEPNPVLLLFRQLLHIRHIVLRIPQADHGFRHAAARAGRTRGAYPRHRLRAGDGHAVPRQSGTLP